VNIIVLTPVRLLGDGLTACFERQRDIAVLAIVNDLEGVRSSLAGHRADLVLIDVTHGIDLYDVRSIAAQWPDVALVALGLHEQRQEVIRCGRAGFTGYVARDASLDGLCKALCDVVEGRLACPAEISGGLLRALFRADRPPNESALEHALTQREGDVLRLIGEGFSNKEIARELALSVATVKHHVHHVLDKMKLQRRAQAMRRVRDAPWLTLPGAARPSAGVARERRES
jgi:DNA-binding NarL/FixJ family response regulator